MREIRGERRREEREGERREERGERSRGKREGYLVVEREG